MTPLLQIAGWTLIHFVWQGAAIAAATATALRLLRDRSADARYLVACAGLTLMFAVPAATARLLWSATAATADAGTAFSTTLADDSAATTTATLRPAVTRELRHGPGADRITNAARTDPRFTFERLLPVITFAWLLGVAVLLAHPL